METFYRIAADVTVTLHLAYVAFVVLGLVAVFAGYFRSWGWVRNRWFRGIHLAMILIVVVEAWAGVVCPLTTLEYALREPLAVTADREEQLREGHDREGHPAGAGQVSRAPPITASLRGTWHSSHVARCSSHQVRSAERPLSHLYHRRYRGSYLGKSRRYLYHAA